MYISDAILLDVDFPEEVFHSPGLSSPSQDNLAEDPDNAALAAAIHAAKAERNDLDAKCKMLRNCIKRSIPSTLNRFFILLINCPEVVPLKEMPISALVKSSLSFTDSGNSKNRSPRKSDEN